jgi:hypothetical protein
MSDIAEHIEGAEKITKIFGYWPSFHDAEIINFNLWRGDVDEKRQTWVFPVLTLLFHAMEGTKLVDEHGNSIHDTLITLRFHSIDNLEVDGFNYQNAMYSLEIERKEKSNGPSPYFEVSFDPAFGIGASFTCLRIEVVEVTPAPSAIGATT